MAHTTVHAPASTSSVIDMLGRAASAVFSFLVQIGESSGKARQINALMELSDAELEERGLKREDIGRYVFQTSAWI